MIRLLPLMAVVTVAACGVAGPAKESSRAGACQMKACTCVKSAVLFSAFAETAPVQWHINGDAYCPDGFVLQLRNR